MTEDVAVIEQFASPGEIEFNSKTLKMRKKKKEWAGEIVPGEGPCFAYSRFRFDPW